MLALCFDSVCIDLADSKNSYTGHTLRLVNDVPNPNVFRSVYSHCSWPNQAGHFSEMVYQGLSTSMLEIARNVLGACA